RGRNAVGPAEREALLGQMRFSLLKRPEEIGLEFALPIGRMKADPDLYRPVIDALAEQPRSFRELAELIGAPDPKLLQALSLLVSHAHVHPVPEGTSAARSRAAVRFNRALAGGLVIEDGPYYLAAGQAGTAIRATFPELLALGAASQQPADVKAAA